MVSSLSKETARISELIKQEQLGEIESVWAEALEKAPSEIDTFLSLAEKLSKAGHGEKAGNLLEQVVNKLDSSGEHIKAVHVLGEVARVAPRNANQKELAKQVFANAFADLPGFDKCVAKAEEESKGSDNRFVKSLYEQLKFQPGDWVFHDAGWGLGEVKEIDAENGELKVDFANNENHKVKLGAAAKFFRKLPPDDIMVMRAAKADQLKQNCKDDPEAVILNVLKAHHNKSNLKRIKAELVPAAIDAKSWAKWWADVRKKLAKHPFIKVGTGTNPTIDRLVTAMTHEDETRERFDYAPRLLQKLEIARRYLRDSERGPARLALLKHIAEQVRKIANRDGALDERARPGLPTLAGERILCAFLIDDLNKAEPELNAEIGYDVLDLVRTEEDLLKRIEEVRDADYQWRALELHSKTAEKAGQNWAKAYAGAFVRNLSTLWDSVARRMLDKDHHEALRKVLDQIWGQSDEYPLQTLWIVRRGIVGGELPPGLELPAANELFARLLWVMNKVLTRIERGEIALKEVLASLRAAMTERNSRLLAAAMQGLSEERAAHLLHEIERCRGLSDIHLHTLRDAVLRSFPNLQAKAASRAAAIMEEETGGEILATEAGLRKRQSELKRIQEEELPEVAKQIGEALAMGDISENAELDAAREKESRLKEAAKEIMEELKRVRVVESKEIDASTAGFGTKVTLKREDGKTKVYTILGRYEADLANNIISNESPIAKGILNKRAGENAVVETPEGAVKYEVISVEKAD